MPRRSGAVDSRPRGRLGLAADGYAEEMSKSLTSVLFRAARLSASGRAVRKGTIARRAKNIVVGRTLRRIGFWRALWK